MSKSLSKASLKRLEKRNSSEMQLFKQRIFSFFEETDAPEEIRYHLVKDLAKMTSMPFYGDSQYGKRTRMPSNKVIKMYGKLLIQYCEIESENIVFVEELLKWLTKQQNQHMRRLSRVPKSQKQRRKEAKAAGIDGVYEHPIPVNYTKTLILNYIKTKNLEELENYVDFIYSNTYQVFLESKWDTQVNRLYHDTMPNNWHWKDESKNNIFQRYIDAQIPPEEYLSIIKTV
jgi:hypothetical protein